MRASDKTLAFIRHWAIRLLTAVAIDVLERDLHRDQLESEPLVCFSSKQPACTCPPFKRGSLIALHSNRGQLSYRVLVGNCPGVAVGGDPFLFLEFSQNSGYCFPRTSNKLAYLRVGQSDSNSYSHRIRILIRKRAFSPLKKKPA